MFERKTSDLHMHLNGSFSLAFLRKTAEKNGAMAEFEKLKAVREEYHQLLAQELLNGVYDRSIALIWAQFALIHKIIKTHTDILEGTIDVMEASTAKYLEIRTTAKAMDGKEWGQYVDAFVSGLRDGNLKFHHAKAARGILSLDRTIHTEQMSYDVIDRVVLEKNNHGLLVGIDISGNPLAERKLTGEGLANVLRYALSKDIGLAIHIGETDLAVEVNDIDIILGVLSAWKKQSGLANPFQGKVRLGHSIFLTDGQRELIKALQIPIEICPSCHEKVNWWNKKNPHPVTSIYKLWKDPVVVGTDDEIIFGGNAEEENQVMLDILGYPKDEDRSEALLHQSKFRFSH